MGDRVVAMFAVRAPACEAQSTPPNHGSICPGMSQNGVKHWLTSPHPARRHGGVQVSVRPIVVLRCPVSSQRRAFVLNANAFLRVHS